jgi:hypothetical protein
LKRAWGLRGPISIRGDARRSAHRPSFSKLIQANPNKTKEKGLDFLGFLWWNLDFSKGYGESKQKFSFFHFKRREMSQLATTLVRPPRRRNVAFLTAV